MLAVVGQRATCQLTRREDLTLGGAEVPGLTITSGPHNVITVVGSNVPDWTLGFLAYADGQNETEARERLQHISITRAGSIVSLNGRGLFEGQHTGGALDIEAPADAPVVIHALVRGRGGSRYAGSGTNSDHTRARNDIRYNRSGRRDCVGRGFRSVSRPGDTERGGGDQHQDDESALRRQAPGVREALGANACSARFHDAI